MSSTRSRHTRTRRWITVSAAIAAAVVLPAVAAIAHPYVVGGEIPVDSEAEVTLAMAHGCGTESDAGGDPTREIALQVDDWMGVVDAVAPDGWEVSYDLDADGRATAVVWTATTAEVVAPQVTVTLVVRGTPGEERYLAVYQRCDDFAYRWIGTPEEPGADPAIRVRLAPADPDRPAPDLDAVTADDATSDAEDAAPDAPAGQAEAPDPDTTADSHTSVPNASADPAPDAEVDQPAALDATDERDGRAGMLPVVVMVAVVAAATAGVTRWWRRRG